MHFLWFFTLVVIGSSQAARIVGIFPSPSISHQLPFQALMKALALRGHLVTVISPEPLKVKHDNYTDVDVSFNYDLMPGNRPDFNSLAKQSSYYHLKFLLDVGLVLCDFQLSSSAMQTFIRLNLTFDLVIMEDTSYQCYYGLIHHFGSPPVIGIISQSACTFTFDTMGNPNNPSYDPDAMLPYSDHMTFWQRLNNMFFGLRTKHYFYNNHLPSQEKVMRKFFGSEPPSVFKTQYNFSLMMVNNHYSMNYPRPLLPSFIELGSLHLETESTPLPEDLQEFLDGAKDGFIYFSLGSNVKSDKLPAHKRQELLEVFAELPQRVLWKWESDSLPGQPSNVKISKWLPQQEVLAHPNIRLFVTQGGLLSLNEAILHEVPIVGIPFLTDQRFNVQKMVSVGAGLRIDFHELTKDLALKTFRTVINDPSYRENVQRLSAINKDQPQTPLQRAVWWTEYVLRHNGAIHMRSAALDLAWYQLLLLDVIGFLAIVLIFTSTAVYFMTQHAFRQFFRYKSKKE